MINNETMINNDQPSLTTQPSPSGTNITHQASTMSIMIKSPTGTFDCTDERRYTLVTAEHGDAHTDFGLRGVSSHSIKSEVDRFTHKTDNKIQPLHATSPFRIGLICCDWVANQQVRSQPWPAQSANGSVVTGPALRCMAHLKVSCSHSCG